MLVWPLVLLHAGSLWYTSTCVCTVMAETVFDSCRLHAVHLASCIQHGALLLVQDDTAIRYV
jgi:hypothetical protein